MSEVNREILVKRASELLANGTVDRVLGWKKGEFSYDVTPALLQSAEELGEFVYDGFCGANLSKYLVKECARGGKVLVFLKPCDTYSFNQLLSEHRFKREAVYAIGIPCDGMLDLRGLRAEGEGICEIAENGQTVTVRTLYDGDRVLDRRDLLAQRCLSCKSKKHVAYDELIGEEGTTVDAHRFDEVEKLEKMTPGERYAFWQKELSRCIRCNACRDVCPACTCEKCVFDNPKSGVGSKASEDSFEDRMYHIIRAFHVAGRCTDCGECSRVCPQQIPLHLLNRKLIKDMNELFGRYQAGETPEGVPPLADYRQNDPEIPGSGRSGGNA